MKMDKRLGWKDRIEYFWMYYKLPFIASVIMLIIAAQWVWAAGCGKEAVLSVMMADCHTDKEGEQLAREFEEYAGIDQKKEMVSVNTTCLLSDASAGTYAMTSLSKFYSDTGTESLDVAGFLEEDFRKYTRTDCFLNLETCMSKETLEKYRPYLYYQEGVPVGIYTEGLPGLLKDGLYENRETKAVVGIMYNSRHVDMAVKYLEYLG